MTVTSWVLGAGASLARLGMRLYCKLRVMMME